MTEGNATSIRPRPGVVAVLGVPFDASSSFRRGAAQAPPLVRERLYSFAGNLCTESGLDLAAEKRWSDLGDLRLPAGAAALEAIESTVLEVLEGGSRLLVIGGDHSITYPIVRAYGRLFTPLTVVHLDAHPDLYDELEGNRISHACPFARIMEEGAASRLIQVGVRAMTPHQREQAERFGVQVMEPRSWPGGLPGDLKTPIYLSIDLDALDPAFAPGVSHPEPGGLTSREVLSIVQSLSGRLVGADIVELNPELDPLGLTAAVAAKLVKEVLAAMLATGGDAAD